jgi:hypothetical protein
MTKLEEEMATLATMSPAQLRERWQEHFGAPPPVGFLPDLLMRALAYDMQEKRYGALSSTVARQIRQDMRVLLAGAASPGRKPLPRTGTRLSREWHGRTHQVEVGEGAYIYRERRYRSLTTIAREITGAAWSGPRFFGLKSDSGDE